jgi:HSP20 family molecular chaperone IbpA
MITQLDKRLDDIFNSKFGFDYLGINQTDVQQIKNDDGSHTLCIDALGHTPKDIDIDVTNKSLVIKSEKSDNSCKLVTPINLIYKLGNNIDYDSIEAEFQNGLLIVRIPIRGDTELKISRKVKIKD